MRQTNPSTGSVTDLILYGIVTALAAVLLVRAVMIAAGLHKGPVMAFLAQYTSDDTYYVLPGVFGWLTLFLWAGATSLAFIEPRTAGAQVLAVPAALLTLAAWAARGAAGTTWPWLTALPAWLNEMSAFTTREERRRIAFLWMRLPKQAQLHYSVSAYHFHLWCDLVILGTVTQTMDDAAVRKVGQVPGSDLLDRLYP